MSATQTRITRQKVQETKAYKGFSNVIKKIVNSRNNILSIERSLNICRNSDYDQWKKQSNAYWANKLIIKEILENES